MGRVVARVWVVVVVLGLAACGQESSTAPSSFQFPVTVEVDSFTGSAPILTNETYPTPHPVPTVQLRVVYPQHIEGVNAQEVLTIFDSTGAMIGRWQSTGPLSRPGLNSSTTAIGTYTPPPFTATVQLRLSRAVCGSACVPAKELCAPGGLAGKPLCQPLAELPGPYEAEVTRSITFQ